MRIDLYFPESLELKERQDAVNAADTIGGQAFDKRFGHPSVHGMTTVRPERDQETLVCVVTVPKTPQLPDGQFVTGFQHFVERLMRALTELLPGRLIRVESPDGGTHLFTWSNEPLRKSA